MFEFDKPTLQDFEILQIIGLNILYNYESDNFYQTNF